MMTDIKAPILVTGIHRSGTTWIGKMLAASREVAYVSEPLNVYHRLGVLRIRTPYWYLYICEENQATILPALQETVRLQYHPGLEIKSLRSVKDLGRMLRDLSWFVGGRLRKARTLLKDPFAVFSAPWFSQQLGCKVVIAVRHPLAFVSSLKRLGWEFDFRDLLKQPLLMRDHLEPFRGEMERMLVTPQDLIGQASLLWRMIYAIVDKFRDAYPEFFVVRHEDLSRQPLEGFRDLYSSLGLPFTPKVQQTLMNVSRSSNPEELSAQRVHSVKLDSHVSRSSNPEELSAQRVHSVKLDSQANLTNWRKRLTVAEIHRIRELTADVAGSFYSENFWE
jgi:hypothetical protein